MNRERYHRMMFLTAALWNWILGITFFVLPRIDESYFTATGLEIPNTFLWFDSFVGLVFVFGIGFFLVSQNMAENHGLIKMALFEKNWVFHCGSCVVHLRTGIILSRVLCHSRLCLRTSIH